MKFLALLLALQQLVPMVAANKLAGPYTTMLAWYAYMMEAEYSYDSSREDRGRANFKIAPGCVGSRPGGVCYFEEFLDYIKIGKKSWPGLGDFFHTTDLYPDMETTGEKLRDTKYQFFANAHKLLPDTFPDEKAVTQQLPKFSAVFDPLIDLIDKIQLDTSSEALGEKKFPRELEQIRIAIIRIHDSRIMDASRFRIKYIDDGLKKINSDWEAKTDLRSDRYLGDWEEFNSRRTLKENGEGAISQGMEQAITTLESQHNVEKKWVDHQAVIEAAERYMDFLFGSCE